jgi:hypothetical protein
VQGGKEGDDVKPKSGEHRKINNKFEDPDRKRESVENVREERVKERRRGGRKQRTKNT